MDPEILLCGLLPSCTTPLLEAGFKMRVSKKKKKKKKEVPGGNMPSISADRRERLARATAP